MSQLAVVTRYVEAMPPRTRGLAAGGALVAVVLAVVLAFVFRADSAALFARPLDADQLAEVQARLTEWDVPFRPMPDNVSVDAARKHDVLLRLAMAGVPHPHLATSAETLKNVNALTPDSVLDAQQRAGLEGDLAEGLRGISGVLDARVILAPATHAFYVDEASREASASVRLTLDGGVTLSPASIAGLRSYVANAVSGLAPERVSVVDQTGADLSAHRTAAAGGSGDEDVALERTLQNALDATVGSGATFVVAHVEVDPSTTTSHEVKRVPLGTAIASDAVREHYVGKNKSYDKLRQNVDRGSDTVERNTRVDAGATKRRSVAVFVDDRQAGLMPRITDLVSAAAGLVPARGDTFAVKAIKFARPHVAAPAPAPLEPRLASFGVPLPALPAVLLALAALGAFLVVGRPFLATLAESGAAPHVASPATTAAAATALDDPARLRAVLASEPPHAAAAILATLPSPAATAVLELYGEGERREIVRRMAQAVAPIVRDVSAQVGRG